MLCVVQTAWGGPFQPNERTQSYLKYLPIHNSLLCTLLPCLSLLPLTYKSDCNVRPSETITSVQKYCNPAVKVRGILFTRFNPQANSSRQMKELAEQLSEYISVPIYKTYIRSAVVVEAQANSQDIFDYANKSTVAGDYKAFIGEFLKGANE